MKKYIKFLIILLQIYSFSVFSQTLLLRPPPSTQQNVEAEAPDTNTEESQQSTQQTQTNTPSSEQKSSYDNLLDDVVALNTDEGEYSFRVSGQVRATFNLIDSYSAPAKNNAEFISNVDTITQGNSCKNTNSLHKELPIYNSGNVGSNQTGQFTTLHCDEGEIESINPNSYVNRDDTYVSMDLLYDKNSNEDNSHKGLFKLGYFANGNIRYTGGYLFDSSSWRVFATFEQDSSDGLGVSNQINIVDNSDDALGIARLSDASKEQRREQYIKIDNKSIGYFIKLGNSQYFDRYIVGYEEADFGDSINYNEQSNVYSQNLLFSLNRARFAALELGYHIDNVASFSLLYGGGESDNPYVYSDFSLNKYYYMSEVSNSNDLTWDENSPTELTDGKSKSYQIGAFISSDIDNLHANLEFGIFSTEKTEAMLCNSISDVTACSGSISIDDPGTGIERVENFNNITSLGESSKNIINLGLGYDLSLFGSQVTPFLNFSMIDYTMTPSTINVSDVKEGSLSATTFNLGVKAHISQNQFVILGVSQQTQDTEQLIVNRADSSGNSTYFLDTLEGEFTIVAVDLIYGYRVADSTTLEFSYGMLNNTGTSDYILEHSTDLSFIKSNGDFGNSESHLGLRINYKL